ncbi:class I SAM-dependent methyltransferase [Brevibacillus daliensis]|uniref:class I SAM-dependent methyltransferase n=1 Tax=Brevibacillus daliensis TaxID=2892995 RepID=UPI001E43482D|nr:class I SAM-dependent methyltransferase [Brevibacillus daliensis]
MSSVNEWNAQMYDHQLGFVSEYGKGLLELLQPQAGERILDLGCGTGDLSKQIAESGAVVIGMDYSEDMVREARNKYPTISFIQGDGAEFSLDQKVDAIFSNAALHWIKRAPEVATCMYDCLRPGGRLVAEFGGKGNVGSIVSALTTVLKEELAIDATKRNPWYFPSVGEYSSLLEQKGFQVTYACLFSRPTQLTNGVEGLNDWLSHFTDDFLFDLSVAQRTHIQQKVSDILKDQLFSEGAYYADYKRLRVIARKPST